MLRTVEDLVHDNPGFAPLAATARHIHGLVHEDPEALQRAATEHHLLWARAWAAEDLALARPATAPTAARVRQLVTARDAFDGCGALLDRARVQQRLDRIRTTDVDGTGWWDDLKHLERTVATLVREGLTNRQIARRMSLSPHTVNYHLRQIFRKLGIRSRVELARIAQAHARCPIGSKHDCLLWRVVRPSTGDSGCARAGYRDVAGAVTGAPPGCGVVTRRAENASVSQASRVTPAATRASAGGPAARVRPPSAPATAWPR